MLSTILSVVPALKKLHFNIVVRMKGLVFVDSRGMCGLRTMRGLKG
jgi:hypothetical protein